MRFCLPANFKINEIEKYKLFESLHKGNFIEEVYGSINCGSPIGSGRGVLLNENYGLQNLKEYIAELHKNQIKFNYTINASCIGDVEMNNEGISLIIEFIELLLEQQVDKLTISSPFLIELIGKKFPEVIITASSIMNINSLKKAKWIRNLGASTIALPEELSRKIPLMESINKIRDIKTEVIINTMCLYNCPYKNFHYNSLSHMKDVREFMEYYTYSCSYIKNSSVEEYLKMPWIRPEDIKIYEEIGVDYFKIIGRERVQKMNLLKMLQYYCMRQYEGNLLELIYGFSKSEKYRVYIDNKMLDGYIHKFKEKDFCEGMCEYKNCTYCKEYTKKAIHIMSRSPINEKKKINNFLEYGTIDDFDEERCICGLL